jgi:hypothetical protein
MATVALVLTSAGAISYAALQLRHERAYRTVANLEKQLGFFLSDKFVEVRRRLAEARLDGTELRAWTVDDPPVVAFGVLDFYEHLALLVKKGHLDLYDVWHTFYEWTQPVYVDMQPLIERDESPYAEHYRDLQRLVHRMDAIQIKKMQRQKKGQRALWARERIIEHYRYELQGDGRSHGLHRRQESQDAARSKDHARGQ